MKAKQGMFNLLRHLLEGQTDSKLEVKAKNIFFWNLWKKLFLNLWRKKLSDRSNVAWLPVKETVTAFVHKNPLQPINDMHNLQEGDPKGWTIQYKSVFIFSFVRCTTRHLFSLGNLVLWLLSFVQIDSHANLMMKGWNEIK